MAHSLFLEALPMMSTWDWLVKPVTGQPIKLKIFEDNQAAIIIVEAGFSTKLCHISRTHGVNITSIKNEVDKLDVALLKIGTEKQAADIFTKGVEPQKWGAAIDVLGIERSPLPRVSKREACANCRDGVSRAGGRRRPRANCLSGVSYSP